MRMVLTLLLILLTVYLWAEPVITINNPYSGYPDFITQVNSGTLPSGSTNYIQNTLSPTIASQSFNVQQGEFSQTGFIMTDANSCTWNTTINASGSLVTTLISCPSASGSRPCAKGMPRGLLLSLTCS